MICRVKGIFRGKLNTNPATLVKQVEATKSFNSEATRSSFRIIIEILALQAKANEIISHSVKELS